MITHKFQTSLILSWLRTNFKLHLLYDDFTTIIFYL